MLEPKDPKVESSVEKDDDLQYSAGNIQVLKGLEG
ncbi:uncharacterized protein METZ01_LOCUS188002, partial [marine metagenome]